MIDYTTELVIHDGQFMYSKESGLEPASLETVLAHYRTMQANLEWFIGLWATDDPARVLDPGVALFQLAYDKMPPVNTWIKHMQSFHCP